MKKYKILITLLFMVALISACTSNDGTGSGQNMANSAAQTDLSSSGDTAVDEIPEGEFNFELPLQTVLIIGTFELQGTQNEITAEQASELLPLWIVLKNLLESDTAAKEEIDALTNQIGETMTDAQMDYINSLDIGPQSTRDLMEKLEIAADFPRPENADEESFGDFQPPEGIEPGMGPGMGQGMGPGAGGGSGVDLSPEQMESFQATREAGGGSMGTRRGMLGNTLLIDALIELLENK